MSAQLRFIGLCLGAVLMIGCDGGAPTRPTPPSPSAQVAVTVTSVTKTTIGLDKFSYSFKLQLTDSGGVSSTVTQVDFAFDNGFGDDGTVPDDQLSPNRRLTANGTLTLELTIVPRWGYLVGNQVYDASFGVRLTDDNGNKVSAWAYTKDLDKL